MIQEENNFRNKADVKKALEQIDLYKELDNDRYKEKIFSKLTNRSQVYSFKKYLKIAAVLVPLLVGLTALYTIYFSKQDNNQVILPGREVAVVELPNGRQIKVDSKKSSPLKFADNKAKIDDIEVSEVGSILEAIDIAQSVNDFIKPDYLDIIIPAGGVFSMTLEDNSKVWLNSRTRMRFPLKFSKTERRVFVDGEAYFEVTKSDVPFIVSTDKSDIKVLGTSFNVNSYKDEKDITVALLTGKVNFLSNNGPVNEILTPGECVKLDRASGKAIKYTDEAELYSLWHTGVFKFRDQKLSDIIRVLQRWYDFEVIYENQEVMNLRFSTIATKTDPLENVLNLLKKTNTLEYGIRGKKVALAISK